MSFCSEAPDGNWPAVTNGWVFPPLVTALLPLFWKVVEDWGPMPLRPARNGRLLLLLLMRPLRSWFVSGTAPETGKMLSLGLEKGKPLIWVLAMIPVTTLADGWVPPRTSCMKKVSRGICGPGVAEAAVVTGVDPVGDVAAVVVVVVVVGVVMGATPATGVGMVLGT